MKIKYLAILLTATYILCPLPALAGEKTAVVKSIYDQIETDLILHKIPHEIIKFEDLENKNIYNNYSAIFLPSGIEKPLHEKINSITKRMQYRSDDPKKRFVTLDYKSIAENLKRFIENGGAVYFSGYSFKLLQKIYRPLSFFDDFPNMGLPGKITLKLKNDLKAYSPESRIEVSFNYPGWIAVKDSINSEVLADAVYETPKGERSGPVILQMKRGKGEVIYSSYYSSDNSIIRRYIIYRLSGKYLLDRITPQAEKFRQEISSRVADSIIVDEYSRKYNIELAKGINTIYFISENGHFQIDILDKSMSLIRSVDKNQKNVTMDFISPYSGSYYVNIYPSSDNRKGRFAFISAKGQKKEQNYTNFIILILSIFILILVLILMKVLKKNKFHGFRMRFF